MRERIGPTARESQIHDVLLDIKGRVDARLSDAQDLLQSDGFFRAFVDGEVINKFQQVRPTLDIPTADYITVCLVDEYLEEFRGEQ
jgi:hypothetical protein